MQGTVFWMRWVRWEGVWKSKCQKLAIRRIMSSYFFITKTFFLYCFIKDASSWILRFKKIWRPKKPGENLENLCVFVQGYTWAIGAVGQFGAGSLKNLITSSQPWQGCRWGLLRVPPQKKAAELFWCVFFFVCFFLIIMNLVLDQNVSSFIIMYHLSSLFVIPLGLVGSTIENLWKNSKHSKWRNLREKTKSVNW